MKILTYTIGILLGAAAGCAAFWPVFTATGSPVVGLVAAFLAGLAVGVIVNLATEAWECQED